MNARQYVLSVLTAVLLLQVECLCAQEGLDLWRNPNSDNFYDIQKKANKYFAKKNKERNRNEKSRNEEEEEGGEYAQFKRWEEFMEPRVYPSGKLINPAKLALDEELRFQGRTGSNARTLPTGNWRSLEIGAYTTTTGWGGGMGRVNCIVPHPANTDILFAGTPAGGIWKTTDAGSSWISLSDGLPFIGVSGIAVNPIHSDSIYILTGDGDGGAPNTFSTGVLLSTNGGDTWQSTGLQWDVTMQTQQTKGYKLLMRPDDRRILFAVTNRGIYKTTDAGITWSLKQSGSFTDMAFNPKNSLIEYAATNKAFYISTDGGDRWTSPSGAGLPDPVNSRSDRIAIGVSGANADYVYLLFGAPKSDPPNLPAGFLGLYRSINSGKSFSLQSNSPNILGYAIASPYDFASQSFYDLAIAVSPIDANEVHVGGMNCWRSLDGGLTWGYTSFWNQIDPPSQDGKYTHADIHALVYNLDGTLFCGSDGGIYWWDYPTETWHDISHGMVITQYYRISSPPDNPGIIYGGTQDNGTNKWTSPAKIMDHQLGGDGMECLVDYTDGNLVYSFGPHGSPLYVTTDGGATPWTKLEPKEGGNWIVPLIMHPTDHTRIYAGYDEVFEITQTGKTYRSISSHVPGGNYVGLAISEANAATLYAAQARSLKICYDVNNPTPEWSDITGTLPVDKAEIADVMASPKYGGEAWVCFSGYSSGNKIYHATSNAGGVAWENISGSLPNVPVNCMVYGNNDLDGVYIGTDIGVFYRDKTMPDWIPFRNGMPNVIVRDLKISNDKIRAATFGRGIWESELYGNCSDSYILSSDVVGYQFFEAGDWITSAANVKGGIGTKVVYRAGNKITLNTGFKVVPQSAFFASIGPCDNTPVYSNRYRGAYEGVMPGALGIAPLPESVSRPANRLKIYPNPFSLQSTVEFYIEKQTDVTISLWDLSGKMIKVLFRSQNQSPGNYQVRLDVAGLSSGGYLVQLGTTDYRETRKIIITK